ncbi:MAG: DUF1501 domain-containing protein [Planctomycetes bacterium]|nr:DUF1501 domain-containing protein [Planctomycetota bacterium]
MNTIDVTRRDFFTTAASGLGGIALSTLLDQQGAFATGAAANPLANKPGHFPAKAKSCIYIFLAGAPSQLDLFDHKPVLQKLDGQKMPESLAAGAKFAFIQKDTARLMASNRKFTQHGQSGMWFSDLLPHLGTCADDICMINTMQTDQFNHHPAQLMMQCGQARFGLPTMGSWLSYGLGTENQNLPSYVVLSAGRGSSGGATLWSNGYLPSVHAGVLLRSQGPPILDLENPAGLPDMLQRKGLDVLRELNQRRYEEIHDPEIASRIANYEMAFRMQTEAPKLTDLSSETKQTLEDYGVNRPEPAERSGSAGVGDQFSSFATNCLLARRMVESGVRFVNIIFASWDHHSNLDKELRYNATMIDQPIAALINDLKQRGLLDETMVVCGGEFGRTPLGENRPGRDGVTGRDHHPTAFSMFMAGGGVRGGYTHGETDEIGWSPARDPVHINDLQATMLKQFGIDHLRLTYRTQGVNLRLTNITREAGVIDALVS